MKKPTPIHQLKAKGNNKRIVIQIIQYEDNSKAVLVATKTLIDFKTRNIISITNLYSIETFAILKDMFSYILNNSEVKNKLFLKELNNISQFKITTSL
tara:strand:+ start:733 stop:1026 length:294 start_codon:yes stop_codon:yes gene_type:complete